MNKPLEFPHNFTRFMEIGKAHFALKEYSEAKDNFEEAYNLKEDGDANFYLASCLLLLSEVKEAKVIIEEMKSIYIKNDKYRELYFRILLINNEMVPAYKLALKFEESKRQELLAEIKRSDAEYLRMKEYAILQIVFRLQNLCEKSVTEQFVGIKEMALLSFDEYVTSSIRLIQDHRINLLVRNHVLSDLVELEIGGDVLIRDLFGNNIVYDLIANPQLITTQRSYLECKKILKEKVEDKDAFASKQLQEELDLQFAFLYPVADDVISNTSLWMNLFFEKYLGEVMPDNGTNLKEIENYSDYQHLINTEIAKLIV